MGGDEGCDGVVLGGGLTLLATATLAPRGFAYPDRVIKLVIPFSPGGATDVVGRLWAEKIKLVLGTVVTARGWRAIRHHLHDREERPASRPGGRG